VNVYLCGQKAFGAAVYRLCRELGHDIAGVSSPARNNAGDGPDGLFDVASLFGTPWLKAGGLRGDLLPANVDLIVAAHSHDFVGSATRRRARYGAIGYHPSLLPRHRGRDAVRWAIKMGDPVTGGTVYWLDGVMDGGPIAAQDWRWILPGDTAPGLWRRELFPLGLDLFRAVLSDVPGYFGRRVPQNGALATFEPACNPHRRYRPDLLMLPPPVIPGGAGYPWKTEHGWTGLQRLTDLGLTPRLEP